MSIYHKQATVGFIFVTMLMDIIGIGIIIPVLPRLLEELIGSNLSDAARVGGWLLFSYALMQFLFSPLIGNISDKYGRRKVLLVSLFVFTIDYLILAFSSTLFWLFLGRILAGITGASASTSVAYIADISTEENKAKNYGVIGAAFGIGFILGPLIGGVLGQYGSRVPFYTAAVLCFINFLYALFFLPESLPVTKRRPIDWKSANPIGSIRFFAKYKPILLLMVAMFFMYMAGHAVNTTWTFFTMYRFGWDEKMVGISLAVVGVMVSLVQGFLVRWSNPKFGNAKNILTGLTINMIGLFLFSIAKESWMLIVFLVPYCIGGIAGPALQTEVTNYVNENEQGQLQGTINSINSSTAIFGPLIMTGLFHYFTQPTAILQLPQAPFVMGAIFQLLAVIFAYRSLKKYSTSL
ncbi:MULTISPECIES: TCR/Tet family MFS transporter [Weeksella]|uniref:TCR/Tet family MFS transporter n=1 Tax=Weeksella TaxID=1013 RepID=UPI0008A48060|nr:MULTISPECIES: TCR/Tet family MFS transporter [Weeksella]MDK7375477.1 TCR/Tet family MFS transporter [Weeksella virosa]OFM84533.1 tetracycline resistance MFS efflux pump [Weeksella sp. HMSC059D05]